MIGRWLVRRREAALDTWTYNAKCSALLAPTPLASSADWATRRARRRLRFWDALLDLATLPDRKLFNTDKD